jgi:hypothetical protein
VVHLAEAHRGATFLTEMRYRLKKTATTWELGID